MADRGTYLTIADEMVRLIESGEWPPGAAIPSETDLTGRFAVARGTIRSALRMVEQRGLIDVKPGRGRFVTAEEDTSQGVPTAAYEVVAQAVLDLIHEEALTPDTPLPSEATLMADFDVSRTTVRRAYRLLQDKGVVYVRQGAGAYVAAL